MNPITYVYHEVLFQPLFNLLVGITNFLPTHNLGIAIILVTLLTRLLLLPSSLHHAKQLQANQSKMADIKKDLKKVQDQFKDDKVKRAEATMALYKKAGINPASGCLPLLIQLPILIALYRVFLIGIGPSTYHYLYSFVQAPMSISTTLLGIDLANPSLLLGVLAGIAQFSQMRWFSPTPAASPGLNDSSEQMMASMQRNMMYIFPVMTIFIALQLPAALALYWVVSTIFAVAQQLIIKRMLHLTVTPPSV
ncbi:MAG: YidC/Oxa1 family membrane protein insertase [Candidatus Andersenbacteria bacterium]